MKISIITATRNTVATIRDTLESVRMQKDSDIEHIIVDAQSTDGTHHMIPQYPHVSHWVSEPDAGFYDAINKGIQMAKGDVVGILNADDVYFDETVIFRIANVFLHEKCDAVYGDLVYVDVHNLNILRRYWQAGAYEPGAFKWGWMPPHPTFFVKRSLYEKYGGYNLELRTSADYELMLRFIHKHRIQPAYIPSVLVKMRMGGFSNRTWTDRLTANRNDRQAWVINDLTPYWFTLNLKPLRKIHQFKVWGRTT